LLESLPIIFSDAKIYEFSILFSLPTCIEIFNPFSSWLFESPTSTNLNILVSESKYFAFLFIIFPTPAVEYIFLIVEFSTPPIILAAFIPVSASLPFCYCFF